MAFFQSQFMNVVDVILGVMMMWPMQYYGYITAAETPYNMHIWYFITAILDSLSVFAIALGGYSTPGDWQTVLQQISFPLTFIFAPLVFSATRDKMRRSPWFTTISSFGAVLLVAGICVTILPGIGDKSNQYTIAAVITYISNNVFSTISFMIKEWVLKDLRGSCVHLNVWNSIYMIPITFALWPLQSLSIYGNIPLDQLPQYLWYGCLCFAGHDVAGGNCSGAWKSELVFSISTFVAVVFAIIMTKRGSAAFQWAANAFVVPMTNLIFGMSIMPTSVYQAYTWYIIVGSVFVSIGIVIYGIGEYYLNKTEVVPEDHLLSPVNRTDRERLLVEISA